MSEGQAGLKRAAMGVIALSSQCIEPMHRAFKHAEASEHEKLGGRIVRVAGFIQVQQVHASLRGPQTKTDRTGGLSVEFGKPSRTIV